MAFTRGGIEVGIKITSSKGSVEYIVSGRPSANEVELFERIDAAYKFSQSDLGELSASKGHRDHEVKVVSKPVNVPPPPPIM